MYEMGKKSGQKIWLTSYGVLIFFTSSIAEINDGIFSAIDK